MLVGVLRQEIYRLEQTMRARLVCNSISSRRHRNANDNGSRTKPVEYGTVSATRARHNVLSQRYRTRQK